MPSTMSTVTACKKTLRASLRKTLKSMPKAEIASQSALVASHVTAHLAFKRAQTISCYLSIPSEELDTSHLIRSILQSGKALFVPRIDRERDEMDMLRIYDEGDLNNLQSGTWGIKEPDLDRDGARRANAMNPDSPRLDLILLPGLAFDLTLSRLGHGRGYYDRFLKSYDAQVVRGRPKLSNRMPILLGLALSAQLLDPLHEPIPISDHDWKVDGVVHAGGLVEGHEGEGNIDDLATSALTQS